MNNVHEENRVVIEYKKSKLYDADGYSHFGDTDCLFNIRPLKQPYQIRRMGKFYRKLSASKSKID